MKKVLFTAVMFGVVSFCQAQQKEERATKFTPPVIVKDDAEKNNSAGTVKFTPPVIVKNNTSKKGKGEKAKTKFAPPVIVKNTEKKGNK